MQTIDQYRTILQRAESSGNPKAIRMTQDNLRHDAWLLRFFPYKHNVALAAASEELTATSIHARSGDQQLTDIDSEVAGLIQNVLGYLVKNAYRRKIPASCRPMIDLVTEAVGADDSAFNQLTPLFRDAVVKSLDTVLAAANVDLQSSPFGKPIINNLPPNFSEQVSWPAILRTVAIGLDMTYGSVSEARAEANSG